MAHRISFSENVFQGNVPRPLLAPYASGLRPFWFPTDENISANRL
jgi:hypothetical protein